MNRPGPYPALALVSALAFGPAGCEDPGPGDALSIDAIGAVGGYLVFDANGTGNVDQGDLPLAGWTVNLDQPAGGTVVSGTTGADGLVTFDEVPVGQMVPAVPSGELGDTIFLVPSSAEAFTLGAFQSAEIRPILTLPALPVEEAREAAPGQPIFTEGVALNSLLPGDLSLHIKASGRYLRILSVDQGGVAIGDSVRVRGRTIVDQGVPMLDGQAVYRLAQASGAPEPILLSTGEAAGARGGSLDAALVGVTFADIETVEDQGDDGVLLIVDDGTGPLMLRFLPALDADADLIDPQTDSFTFAVGLLVPTRVDGVVVWEIRPRTGTDVAMVRSGG